MSVTLPNSAIWDEINRSESYLVCCMFEEAVSLSSSVLEHICKTDATAQIEDIQLADMMESAGMVLVQSLKELGRTSEMLNELKTLFGAVTAIPFQVLLTGVCFQISEGSCSGLQEFIDEFLGKWRYVDGQFYILSSAEPNGAYLKGCDGRSILEIEKYLEVVEVYTLTFLGTILNDTNLAMEWVEKAELPEENRQELLRRLRSLYSLMATNSSQSAEIAMPADKTKVHSHSFIVSTVSGVEGTSEVRSPLDEGHNRKQTILKFTKQVEPCLWWFRTVTLKIGNAQLVFSHGKVVVWGSLIIFIYYILQKKQTTLKRIFSRKALSLKKALVDMWQLAFSVQVNPLAAVQPLPAATRGSR